MWAESQLRHRGLGPPTSSPSSLFASTSFSSPSLPEQLRRILHVAHTRSEIPHYGRNDIFRALLAGGGQCHEEAVRNSLC